MPAIPQTQQIVGIDDTLEALYNLPDQMLGIIENRAERLSNPETGSDRIDKIFNDTLQNAQSVLNSVTKAFKAVDSEIPSSYPPEDIEPPTVQINLKVKKRELKGALTQVSAALQNVATATDVKEQSTALFELSNLFAPRLGGPELSSGETIPFIAKSIEDQISDCNERNRVAKEGEEYRSNSSQRI